MPQFTPPPSAPAPLRSPAERIDRRAVAWWTLRAVLLWGPALAIPVAAAILWPPLRAWLIAPIVVLAVLFLLKLCVEPGVRYLLHRWEISDGTTYAAQGWIVREWRVAPSSRIQTVDAVRGPLEHLLGLSTLRITTASAYGTLQISGLSEATATAAAAALSEFAELSEGDAT